MLIVADDGLWKWIRELLAGTHAWFHVSCLDEQLLHVVLPIADYGPESSLENSDKNKYVGTLCKCFLYGNKWTIR